MLTGTEPGFVQAPDFTAPALPVLPLQEAELAEHTPPMNGVYVDFRLRADSRAVDVGAPGSGTRYHHQASGAAPDLGAIELGDAWEFARPGPAWAVGENRPWRPALPPSLHPSWVGLADQ